MHISTVHLFLLLLFLEMLGNLIWTRNLSFNFDRFFLFIFIRFNH